MIYTVNSLYKHITDAFEASGIDDAKLESRYIIMKVLDFSYSDVLLNATLEVNEVSGDSALRMMNERLSGRPIQYVLGEWDFLDYTFKVGEGVLIPRPETELLCQNAYELLKGKKQPVIFDLCSGSGCIGISMKMLIPESEVFLVEKSQEAFEYTKLNADNICGKNAPILLNADILNFSEFDDLPLADLILSNPPYIKRSEIPLLQKEVQKEPVMALDGGEDGLIFYRALCSFWMNKLKDSGIMVLECGEEQANDIINIFSSAGYFAECIKDFNGIERIIKVRRTKCLQI